MFSNSSSTDCSQAPVSDIPVVKVNGKLTRSMATFRDEKLVSAVKRQIVTAFNANAVHDYEHHIDLTIEALLDLLRVKGPQLDLMPILSFFSFDTICRLAFSDTLDLMANQTDLDNVLEAGRARFRYWHKWFPIPAIESFLFKNRFVPSGGTPSSLGDLAKKRLQARLEKGGAGVHHDLLDRLLQARGRDSNTFSLPVVMGLTVSIIHAGSETTAHTVGNVLWDLLRHPEVYQRLKTDIRSAGLSSPPHLAEVRSVPYIEACIKESMRMANLITDPFERVVPANGATICGVWVPGGTVVCMYCTLHHFETHHLTTTAANAAALAYDSSIYGQDVNEFNPDRWLRGTDQDHVAMERATFAFSQGKRNCIGMHLAWAEMLKLLPAILNEFDVSVYCKVNVTEAMLTRLVLLDRAGSTRFGPESRCYDDVLHGGLAGDSNPSQRVRGQRRFTTQYSVPKVWNGPDSSRIRSRAVRLAFLCCRDYGDRP